MAAGKAKQFLDLEWYQKHWNNQEKTYIFRLSGGGGFPAKIFWIFFVAAGKARQYLDPGGAKNIEKDKNKKQQ